MKKSSIAIVIALIAMFSLNANEYKFAKIENSESGSFELYSPSAELISDISDIDSAGYLIRVKDQEVKLSTAKGDIYLKSNSDLLFAEENPLTLYLLSGTMNVVLPSSLDENVLVYTPTTVVKLNMDGEYAFISTDDNELFYNLSKYEATAFDGIIAKEYTVEPDYKFDYIAAFEKKLSKNELKEISVKDSIIAAIPEAPAVKVQAVLKKIVPDKPSLNVKESNLFEEGYKLPGTPELKVIKSELVAKAPEAPTFTLTTVSALTSSTPDLSAIKVKSELKTLPVAISGRFVKPAPVFNVKEDVTVEKIKESAPVISAIETSAEKKTDDNKNTVSEISGEAEKKFVFDMMFSTRAYTDSETTDQAISFSFQPIFKYGSFALTLNLDPIHILDYSKNENAKDWIRYSIAFLESLRYRTLNEHFDITIDKTTDIDGDSVGLYSGVNHIWDGKTERLGLQTNVTYSRFSIRAYVNDLLLNVDRKLVLGVDSDVRLSGDTAVGFTLGLLAATDLNDFKSQLMLYPEFSFYLPFYSNGADYIGMKAGTTLAFNPNTIANYDIEKYGYLISGIIPIKFGKFTAEPGIHYTNGPLHYNSVDSTNYTPITVSDSSILTVASKFGYAGSMFGVKANIFFDVALKDMTTIKQNSFLDASMYMKINEFRVFAGANIQNFTTLDSYKNDNAKIYGGIDFTFPGVTTYLKAGITDFENKNFFLTYGATASFLSSDKSVKETKARDQKFPVHFDLVTGYKYKFEEDKAAYLLKPIVKFGNDDYFIALRAPIQLSFNDDKEFYFEGQNGNKWWDFGASESTSSRKLFRAITDSVSLIDEIALGASDNLAYLIAERGWRKNGTLFTAFGNDDALSLRTGFNFANLTLGLFVDNLEAPHIGEFCIDVLPLGQDSLSIGINIPSEILFKDLKNFDMNYYPEVRLDVPIYKNIVTLSALAIGHIGVEYIDGVPNESAVIYDFENNKFSSALAGGEIKLNLGNASLKVQSGYRVGSLSPDMYNRFTSIYNEIPTSTSSTTALGISRATSDDGVYGKLSTTFTFKRFDMEFAYTASNIKTLITDHKNVEDDLFSLKLSYSFNDALTLYGSLDRRGFAKLFDKSISFVDDAIKDKNTLFTLGFDWAYGVLNMNAEYATSLLSSGYSADNPYVNANAIYTGKTTQSLSVTTRIHF